MARLSMSAPVTAETLIGTSASGSSMRVAVTTAASANEASRSVIGGSATGSAPTATPSTVTSPKPLRSAATAYSPGARPSKANRPRASVCPSRSPSGPPRSTTVAPGSTAPVASRTTPERLPDWADAVGANAMPSTTRTAAAARRSTVIGAIVLPRHRFPSSLATLPRLPAARGR